MNRCGACASVAFAVLMSWSCGSTTPTAPFVPQVSGSWVGEGTLTSFTGGECLTPLFEELKGIPTQFRGSLAQTGNNVTATLSIDHVGGTCSYAGSIGGDTLVLNATSCDREGIAGLSCADGAVRDIRWQASSLTARIIDAGMTGTFIETDAIAVSGTSTNVGTFAGTGSFTLTRE